MNLEDHVGDIIRKARAMSGVSARAAAGAAGISERDLAELEATGQAVRKPDYHRLARLIGVDGVKLEQVAAGWAPAGQDLARWREFRCLTTTDGGMAVNCYLVWDPATREAALFDTGWSAEPIVKEISEHQLELYHVFITHSHEDHVAALAAIRQRFPQARAHSGSSGAPLNERLRPGETIALGGLRVSPRDTPGHAPDGTTYVVENWPAGAPPVAMVGDAIFAGSIGRGNQSWELARSKVREHILSLPADTLICPGHGPLTTVAEERAHNPFF